MQCLLNVKGLQTYKEIKMAETEDKKVEENNSSDEGILYIIIEVDVELSPNYLSVSIDFKILSTLKLLFLSHYQKIYIFIFVIYF